MLKDSCGGCVWREEIVCRKIREGVSNDLVRIRVVFVGMGRRK